MRSRWIGYVALLSTVAFASAQKVSKQRFSQPASASDAYGLKLHVSHSFLVQQGRDSFYLHLVGSVNGMDVELVGGPEAGSLYRLLVPGEYPVRLIGEDRNADGSIEQQYDLLLNNGQHEAFTLMGLSE